MQIEEDPKKLNVKELWKEYAPPKGDDYLFSDEEDIVLLLKEIIETGLTSFDRTIFLLYVENGSLRQVAKELNVSHTAITKKMDQIKQQVFSQLYDHQAKNLNKEIRIKINNIKQEKDN